MFRRNTGTRYFQSVSLKLQHHLSRVCAGTRHADLASAFSHHPADSESELSVSGFLSVASQSCEEDEGRDAPLLCHPSALRGPTGMSGEGNHGNQPAQYIGVKKHRWDTLQK